MMINPAWITEAYRHVGLKEIKGLQNNPQIVDFWKAIKRSGIKDDETPWCAAFVGACLEAVGVKSTRYESAKSYLDWGIPVPPCVGAVVVFTREGGGHVGFIVGEDSKGNLMVIGGNQGDAVNIKAFSRDRVSGIRWPSGTPFSGIALPLLAAAELSRSEA